MANNKSNETIQANTRLNPDVNVSDSQKKDENEHDHVIRKSFIKPYKCKQCDLRFCSTSARSRHFRRKHFTEKRRGLTECVDCLLDFKTKIELREHLQDHHDLDMSPVYLYFPKIEEFHTWKSNIERETLTIYHRAKSSCSPLMLKYICARSGKVHHSKTYQDKDRCVRRGGSVKLGTVCTAEIQAKIFGSELIVKHYAAHYGHGKGTVTVQISPEEQSAVDELAEKGLDSEKLLKELSSEAVDCSQMYPMKKRYLNCLKRAYKAEDFNTGMSDLDCVSDWVKRCSDMEECPVLFCLQENIAMESEKFILVIMTEFQRQILVSASKQLICVDVIFRVSDVHLITILVIDELMTAFPVAYCLSNKLNENVIKQFFTSIKEYAGNLSPEYLMTNHDLYFYESWVEVMNNCPLWLWNRWETDRSIVNNLRLYVKGNHTKRRELYDLFQIILDCKSKDVATHLFKNFIDKIQQDEKLKKIGEWAMRRLGIDIEKWVICFQKEINANTILHLDVMHHIYFQCGVLGKGKRLYTFLSVLMKMLRHNMLDRILNSFDEEKINLAVHAIDFCHEQGLAFPSDRIFSLSNNLWMIQLDELNKVYVTQDVDDCPDHCSLRCKQCEICVHQFSCSCVNNMINANLCLHIHAIVYKFLRPNKFQYTSSDKLFNLEANYSRGKKHTLNSTLFQPYVTKATVQPEADFSLSDVPHVASESILSDADFSSLSQEPFATNEIVQSEADFFSPLDETYATSKTVQPTSNFSPSQARNLILIETTTSKEIPAQSATCQSSLVATPPEVLHFSKLFSTKLSDENLSSLKKFLLPEKSNSHSVQNFKSVLKRKAEMISVEAALKNSKIKKLNNENTFKEIVSKKTTKVPRIACESTNMSVEKTAKLPKVKKAANTPIQRPLEKSETKDMVLKNTTTLFQMLKTQKLSKNSFIAINKFLNECINIASTDEKEIVEIPY